MSGDAVELAIDAGIAEIALNRPDRGNAMGRELLRDFAAAVARVRADPAVRVVLVTGRGKHFCTGADFRDGPQQAAAELGGGPGALRRALRAVYDPFLSVLQIEVPTIAAVHGAAIGGGLGLALACDLRLVAEDARLQANFVRLGITPGMAVSWFLPRLVGPQHAAEMLFTGLPVHGIAAASIGLALRAVPATQLHDAARELAASIALGSPEAVRLTKSMLRHDLGGDPRAHADAESVAQAHCFDLPDAREGIAAALQKREPRF